MLVSICNSFPQVSYLSASSKRFNGNDSCCVWLFRIGLAALAHGLLIGLAGFRTAQKTYTGGHSRIDEAIKQAYPWDQQLQQSRFEHMVSIYIYILAAHLFRVALHPINPTVKKSPQLPTNHVDVETRVVGPSFPLCLAPQLALEFRHNVG